MKQGKLWKAPLTANRAMSRFGGVMIRKLTSSQWAAASFGIFLIVLMVGIGWMSYQSVQMQSKTAGWVEHTQQVLNGVQQVLSGLKDSETGQRGYLITGDEAYLAPYTSGTAGLADTLAELRRLTADNPRQQKRLNTLDPLVTAKLEELKATIDLRRQSGFEAARAVVLTDKGKAIMGEIRTTIADIAGEENVLMIKRQADAVAVKERATTVIVGGTLISAVIAMVLTYCLIYVARVNVAMDGTVEELTAIAEEILLASAEVARSNQTVAAGATQQAASIEETSASTDEINAMARRNTDNATTTASIVGESQARFVDTSRLLDHMVVSMEEMNSSSDKISKIIQVIDGIAFQTNILALNAAVEAARAGEAGLGFAVVADEVRNLAQRSAQAAKDTTELIEDTNNKAKRSKIQVEEVAAAVRLLTAGSEKIKGLVDEIHVGSDEQARGLVLISHAVSNMEKVTQSTAATSEQSAAAAEELSSQSKTLAGIVANISTLIGKQPQRIARGRSRTRASHSMEMQPDGLGA